MASTAAIPEFDEGQRLLAADFAALVHAVRALGGAGSPVIRTQRQERTMRPFFRAGTARVYNVQDTVMLSGGEMLWQVGDNVTLLPDVPAAETVAPDPEKGLMVHAAIRWEEIGHIDGYTLRAVSHELTATVPEEGTEEEDGSITTPYHGELELTAFGAADPRGKRQFAAQPWVQPQRPCLAWRMGGDGQLALLPAPQTAQVLAYDFHHANDPKEWPRVFTYRRFFARLDAHGFLHMETDTKEYTQHE